MGLLPDDKDFQQRHAKQQCDTPINRPRRTLLSMQ